MHWRIRKTHEQNFADVTVYKEIHELTKDNKKVQINIPGDQPVYARREVYNVGISTMTEENSGINDSETVESVFIFQYEPISDIHEPVRKFVEQKNLL
jgi:hypothetical protein